MPSKAAAGKLLETPGSRQKRIESMEDYYYGYLHSQIL